MQSIIVSAVVPSQGQQLASNSNNADEIRRIVGISKTQGEYWKIISPDKLFELSKCGLLHPAIHDALVDSNIPLDSRVRVTADLIEPNKKPKEVIIVGNLSNIKYGRLDDSYQLDLREIDLEKWEGQNFFGDYLMTLDKHFENVRINRKITFREFF